MGYYYYILFPLIKFQSFNIVVNLFYTIMELSMVYENNDILIIITKDNISLYILDNTKDTVMMA